MSRDPDDGNPIIPRTLHKYLYAGGDPVNAVDPSGHSMLVERFLLNLTIVSVAGFQYVQRMNGQDILVAVGALACLGDELYELYERISGVVFEWTNGAHGEEYEPSPDTPFERWCAWAGH